MPGGATRSKVQRLQPLGANQHSAGSPSTLVYPTFPVTPLLSPIQAQYYRDPDRLDAYLANNKFLADINNEIPGTHNATYAKNLATLNKLVLVLFSEDITVVPKESSWFGSYAPSDETFPGEKTIIPMRKQELYIHDTIGLKRLDEEGDIIFKTCEGVHMQLTDDCWRPLVEKFVGGAVRNTPSFRTQI